MGDKSIGHELEAIFESVHNSVGIDLKELGGGQLSKCLKFCRGIEI